VNKRESIGKDKESERKKVKAGKNGERGKEKRR